MRLPLPRPTAAGRAPGLSAQEAAAARQVASLLLCYPDEQLLERLPLLRTAVAGLPAPVAEPLGRALDHVASTPLERQQVDYVETFDLRRRCCPYLTYYAHGDTRKRGMALLQVKHLYVRAGFVLEDGELPDHVAVVLEFAAREWGETGEARRGERVLREHRAGLELLRISLRESGSAYADVVEAACATLPPVAAEDRAAAMRLAQEGPPSEDVGLGSGVEGGLAPYPLSMSPELGARA